MSINDFFGDFPDRPTHEDFTALADVVLEQDGKLEDADFDFAAYLDETVNHESLEYMALHRARQFTSRMGLVDPAVAGAIEPLLAAIFMDAFLLGTTYQERYRTTGPATA